MTQDQLVCTGQEWGGGNGLASSPEIAATDVLRSRLFPELDIADADDAAITDADREDADVGMLPSEQLATSTVSGQKTKVDEAPTGRSTDHGPGNI